MIDAGGASAGEALGGAITGRASEQAPSVLAANVHGANKNADQLGAGNGPVCATCCSPETLKANIINCDGGAGVWNKATAALGNEPTITLGDASGYAGQMTPDGARMKPSSNCCEATQYAIIELSNVGNKQRFANLDRDAAAGDLGREDYARYKEQIEYDAVMNSVNAFDSCKTAWGCEWKAISPYEAVRSSGNFADYYSRLSGSSHTSEYRTYWDQNYKGAYDGKHP